jgi:hypothetical protein
MAVGPFPRALSAYQHAEENCSLFTVLRLVYWPVRQSRSHIRFVFLRGRAAQNVNDDPGEFSFAQRGGMQRHNSERRSGFFAWLDTSGTK